MSLTAKEKADIEFKELLEAKRHKELLTSVKSIVEALSNVEGDKDIVFAVNKQTEKLKSLVEVLSKEEDGNTDVIASNNQVIEKLNQFIETLNNRLLPDTFTLNKNSVGITESVKVHYKPASQIN